MDLPLVTSRKRARTAEDSLLPLPLRKFPLHSFFYLPYVIDDKEKFSFLHLEEQLQEDEDDEKESIENQENEDEEKEQEEQQNERKNGKQQLLFQRRSKERKRLLNEIHGIQEEKLKVEEQIDVEEEEQRKKKTPEALFLNRPYWQLFSSISAASSHWNKWKATFFSHDRIGKRKKKVRYLEFKVKQPIFVHVLGKQQEEEDEKEEISPSNQMEQEEEQENEEEYSLEEEQPSPPLRPPSIPAALFFAPRPQRTNTSNSLINSENNPASMSCNLSPTPSPFSPLSPPSSVSSSPSLASTIASSSPPSSAPSDNGALSFPKCFTPHPILHPVLSSLLSSVSSSSSPSSSAFSSSPCGFFRPSSSSLFLPSTVLFQHFCLIDDDKRSGISQQFLTDMFAKMKV